MSRNLNLGALGLGFLALGLGLAAGATGAPRRTSDLELLILSTTTNRGEVDPCG